MDQDLRELYLKAGLILGRESICDGKIPYITDAQAQTAANAENLWDQRHHDYGPYPCVFCGNWHVGQMMPQDQLEKILADG